MNLKARVAELTKELTAFTADAEHRIAVAEREVTRTKLEARASIAAAKEALTAREHAVEKLER